MENQIPPQTPPGIIIPQPKPNYLKTVIFSILGVLLVSAIIFLYLQNQKLQKQVLKPQISPTIQAPSPIPKAVSSISIPPDITTEWKKFTDFFGYTFSYPKELQLEESKDKIIVRIDPPDIRDIVGICPRYISFSLINEESTSKILSDKYSCVYETKILDKKIYVESQYPKNKKNLIDQILSTFKFFK